MRTQEFRELLSLGHETTGAEFKAPGPRTDKNLLAKVTRAILALSNRRNGGRVIVGVDDDGQSLTATGIAAADLDTWRHEDVSGAISAYADPFVTLHTAHVQFEGKDFVVIDVEEFEEVPVVCKRSYPDVLRDGACYIRRRGRIESSEIPNSSEMRELLDLATEKSLRRFSRLRSASEPGPNDDELFDQELGDLR